MPKQIGPMTRLQCMRREATRLRRLEEIHLATHSAVSLLALESARRELDELRAIIWAGI